MITTLNFGLSTRSSVWLVLVTGENCTVLWILSPSPIGFLGSLSHYDDPPYGVLSSPVKRLVSYRDKSRNGPITYKVFAKRVFEKSHIGAIRLSMRRIAARSIIVSEVCTRYSQSLLSRRFLPSQAKLHSTIQVRACLKSRMRSKS